MLDDDIIGTRSQENPVKSLSSRKSDKAGLTANVVADALSRLVLSMSFRRRGETLSTGVHLLLYDLIEGHGETSLVS